jgi:hypothetical protein
MVTKTGKLQTGVDFLALDSNWAAQGWQGISSGLISLMRNAYALVSQAPRSIWTVQES